MEIQARLLQAQDKGKEAAELIQKYVEGKDAEFLNRGAVLLEELGQTAAAEAMYRRYVSQSKQPDSELVLAQFLARRDQTKEALELCERAWQQGKPDTVARTCVVLFATAKLSDEQRQSISRWLEEALQKDPQSPSLPFRLAVVREYQGQYPQAEALYRQAIARASSRSPL